MRTLKIGKLYVTLYRPYLKWTYYFFCDMVLPSGANGNAGVTLFSDHRIANGDHVQEEQQKAKELTEAQTGPLRGFLVRDFKFINVELAWR
jgi:hypothetical protein